MTSALLQHARYIFKFQFIGGESPLTMRYEHMKKNIGPLGGQLGNTLRFKFRFIALRPSPLGKVPSIREAEEVCRQREFAKKLRICNIYRTSPVTPAADCASLTPEERA